MNEDKFEIIELAVKEQAEEQARANHEIRELVTTVNLFRNELATFAEKLNNQNITVNTDARPVQNILESYLLKMNLIVEKALSKMRTDVWQLYFHKDGPKWTVLLIVVVTFLFLTYRLFFRWLIK